MPFEPVFGCLFQHQRCRLVSQRGCGFDPANDVRIHARQKLLLFAFRALSAPGGRLLVLEFSKVWDPLKKVYDVYSFKVLPWLGDRFAKDAESYRYLAESIRMHPDQETLKTMMEQAGLDGVKYYNLSAGVVALHVGTKY